MPTDPFHLPENQRAKAAPSLLDADRAHLQRIAEALTQQRTDVARRLDAVRVQATEPGSATVDRDLETRRLSARLRVLERFDLDICLGRMTPTHGDPLYIGRTGLTGLDGTRLLVDWRAPAAEPYFAATMADPRGIVSRRRYRWAGGRIVDYWDEALTAAAFDGAPSLDDQSSFLASLETHRTPRMRDVLATIQADQDAIIRSASPGALIVDGGPGTGKTVVALHRAAHLLYSEPRLTQGAGGVLLLGPSAPYLAYVADVLPGLGEDTVRLGTLRDLTPEGADALPETDPRVAELKAALDPDAVLGTAVAALRQPPDHAMRIDSPWADLWLSREEWAEAFAAADPSGSHNDARDDVWEQLMETLVDQVRDDDVPPHIVRRWLRQDDELTGTFRRAWPLLSPTSVVARLWSSPRFLAHCAPGLSDTAIALLQREAAMAWTDADLPLLDAAHRRIGDPESVRQEHRRQAVIASAQEQMSHVVDHLIESDDSEMKVMSILRGQDTQNVLIGVDRLRVNYRTPAEIMAAAEPVIRTAIPDANVPTSVRASGIPVGLGDAASLPSLVGSWLTRHPEGTACVIGDATYAATDRVRSLTPEGAKGLEFDLVVLVRPERFGQDLTGAVDTYVAMTRATRELVVLR